MRLCPTISPGIIPIITIIPVIIPSVRRSRLHQSEIRTAISTFNRSIEIIIIQRIVINRSIRVFLYEVNIDDTITHRPIYMISNVIPRSIAVSVYPIPRSVVGIRVAWNKRYLRSGRSIIMITIRLSNIHIAFPSAI